jgi:hypothetical protein
LQADGELRISCLVGLDRNTKLQADGELRYESLSDDMTIVVPWTPAPTISRYLAFQIQRTHGDNYLTRACAWSHKQ